jgi:hypothetical protein
MARGGGREVCGADVTVANAKPKSARSTHTSHQQDVHGKQGVSVLRAPKL